jgi:hypothetical protein
MGRPQGDTQTQMSATQVPTCIWAKHWRKHACSSHGTVGVSQTPPLHVCPDGQSAALQHWAAHWHCIPTLLYPLLQVTSQVPCAEHVGAPFAVVGHGAQLAELRQPVPGVFPAQTPPHRC